MNTKKYLLIGGTLLCALISSAQTDSLWSGSRPDGHAPIHIMADHAHKKGNLMVSYRFMPMSMSGVRTESQSTSTEAIHQNYMVAPLEMTMSMHMVGIMFAPSDRFTLMAMANYNSNNMSLRTKMGMDFTTSSSGLGDVKISVLSKLINRKRQILVANLGISLPTGSIDQKDDTPMMQNAQLAYPMQLGSGTYDPFARLTYQGQSDHFSWGAQIGSAVRFGTNNRDYTLGNTYFSALWGAIKISRNFSSSLSVDYSFQESISGADSDLNPMMMPLFDSKNSGRQQITPSLGLNFWVSDGPLKNFRLAMDFGMPIYQSVTGTQMEQSWYAIIGAQYGLKLY